MKKLLTMIMALALILSLAAPAYAYDGSNAPHFQNSWWNCWNWWNDYLSGKNDTTPDATELGTTTINEARFYHTAPTVSLSNRLQISWDTVDNATSYEIEVVKADGTVVTYTSSSTSLMVTKVECPKVYIEATNTWAAASVRIRAIAENTFGDWSPAAKIGCDKIH